MQVQVTATIEFQVRAIIGFQTKTWVMLITEIA